MDIDAPKKLIKLNTVRKFLNEYRSLPQKGWTPKLQSGGILRLIPPDKPNSRYCPITAVCKELTGVRYSPGNYRKAAFAMSMASYLCFKLSREAFVNKIVCAADSVRYDEAYQEQYKLELRNALLKPFGLQG